jgi:predicted acylesterase/phospholipase RssA
MVVLGAVLGLFVPLRLQNRSGFRLFAIVHLIVIYFGVTFVLGHYNWLPALVTMVLAAGLLTGGLAYLFPNESSSVLHEWNLQEAGRLQREIEYRPQALPALLAGTAFFVLICVVTPLASQIPTVCCFFFGVIALYGFLNLVVRRAMPQFVIFLVFCGVLGGVQPYKQRFNYFNLGNDIPGLEYGNDDLVDLHDHIGVDRARQLEFDRLWPEYWLASEEHRRLEHEVARLEEQLKNEPTSAEREQIKMELAKQTALLPEAQRRLDDKEKGLKKAWDNLEKNRVLPGRLPSPVNGLTQRLRGSADDGKRLLSLEDLETPEDRPLIVVVVSGGGLRSAAWTLTVLHTLEEEFAAQGIDFPAHVRMITGASGGMLGAAYYVACLDEPKNRRQGFERRNEMDEQFERLTRDGLTPLMNQFVFGDLPAVFSPWPCRFDRGKALEQAWSVNMAGKLDMTFAELRDSEKHGWRPSLVFTPMLVEDGRRIILSNLDMRHPLSNDGNLLTGDSSDFLRDYRTSDNYSVEAFELFRLIPGAQNRVRLSTAIRMSASFPFFSPAVSLPTRPRRRVVDAGYYDNFGVNFSAAWLFTGSHRSWLEKHASKVVLIQIRDGISDAQRSLRKLNPEKSTRQSRAVEEMSSPLEGLYNGQFASSAFRNDGQLELLSQYIREKDETFSATYPYGQTRRRFTVVTFEFPEQAALSWYLSAQERSLLRKAIERKEFGQRMRELLEWWKRDLNKGVFLRDQFTEPDAAPRPSRVAFGSRA